MKKVIGISIAVFVLILATLGLYSINKDSNQTAKVNALTTQLNQQSQQLTEQSNQIKKQSDQIEQLTSQLNDAKSQLNDAKTQLANQAVPTQSPTPAPSASSSPHVGFGLGSTKDQVQAIMGTPDKIEDWGAFTIWSYGTSTVEFDTHSEKVTGWDNRGHNLLLK